jgi:aryl-alcohol dehydrogenase-like predicted oxidoreductase
MKYNSFINNSPKVSEVGLGAWQLGENTGWDSLSEKEAIDLVKKSLDLGVNFFDTAPNYGLGTSETRLGKALKNTDRDSIVINTKFGHSVSGELNFSSDSIRESLEGSLRRLKVDFVDSFIIHSPPFEILDGSKNDHYDILERLKDEGKIRAYGASVDTPEEMKLFMNTTSGKVIEAFFNILHQETAAAFPMAKEKGVKIIAKIPLDSGWLSGKYDETSKFTDIRERWTREDIQTRSGLVRQLKKLVGEDRDLAQTAIAFCAAYDAVATVIPGNKNLLQLKQNMESVKHPLPDELIEQLESFYRDEVKHLNLPW